MSTTTPGTTQGALVAWGIQAAPNTAYGPFVCLATGDSGALSVTSYQMDADNTGTLCMVLCRPLVLFTVEKNLADYNLLKHFPVAKVILDGACLSFMGWDYNNTNGNFWGQTEMVFG